MASKKAPNFSNEEKELLEELIYLHFAGQNELKIIARIYRWLLIQFASCNDEDLFSLTPKYFNKVKAIQNDPELLEDFGRVNIDLTWKTQVGTRRLPPAIAELYWRVLEYCKNSKHNYEWFRNYVKPNGKLEFRLKDKTIDFLMPSVPANPSDTSWARQLKKNMGFAFAVVDPRIKTRKVHDEFSKLCVEYLTETNESFFEIWFTSLQSKPGHELNVLPEDGLGKDRFIKFLLGHEYNDEAELLNLSEDLGIKSDFKY